MEQTEAVLQPKTAPVKGGAGLTIALCAAAGLLAALVGGYLALCAYAGHSPAIWKGVQVLGQDLGGLTVEQAAEKLDAALPGMEIGVYLYDGALEFPPERADAPDAVLPLSSLNAVVDTAGLAWGADRTAREGPFLTAGWRYLTHSGLYYGGSLEDIAVDPDSAEAAAAELLDHLARPAQDASYELSGETLLVHTAREGRGIDAQVLQDALQDRRWELDLTLDIPCETLPARSMTAREIHDAVSGEARNAGYDAATDTITEERAGADFNVVSAQRLLDDARPGDTVSIPATIELPAVTAGELRAVLFRDVLGEATTRVSGTAARISNVRLASSAVNGTVLNAGDVFSYNGTVGQRTAAKGYQAAPAYVQGETVDEIGGGVCQPSSTLYLACLNSNLEITQRQAHRYVPAYIAPGMDATVSWGGPDYQFTNNTAYPIKISAVYANGSLTMRIYGTKTDDTTVRMTNQRLSTTPYETVYQDDPSLPPGTTSVKTTPYTGYRYQTFRNLYDGNGALISSEFEAVSDYKSRNQVILRGPAAEAPPSETPAETPAEAPEETSPESPGETPEEAPPEASEETPQETPAHTVPPADEENPFIILPAE